MLMLYLMPMAPSDVGMFTIVWNVGTAHHGNNRGRHMISITGFGPPLCMRCMPRLWTYFRTADPGDQHVHTGVSKPPEPALTYPQRTSTTPPPPLSLTSVLEERDAVVVLGVGVQARRVADAAVLVYQRDTEHRQHW